jgi:hypothetical protein
MYLKMIAVEASAKASMPSEPVFRWTVHHVKEIFLALLPQKFVLDGSSKVQITCGPCGDESQYQRVLGTTDYFREDFDFLQYYALKPAERDNMLLTVLQESLFDIASRVNECVEAQDVILAVARDVASHEFSLKLHSRRLSKVTSCRRLRVNIYRNLNRQVGEVWSSEVIARDHNLIHEEWIGEMPHYLDLTDFYKSSTWKGNVFVVQNRFGKTVYELDVNPFLVQI